MLRERDGAGPLLTARALLLGALFLAGCEEPDPHAELMAGSALVVHEEASHLRVVVLAGTPYQMGYQQGVLLAEQIEAVRRAAERDLIWNSFLHIVENEPLDDDRTYWDHVLANSLETVVEECRGLVDGSDHAMELFHCVVMSSVTYIMDDFMPRFLPGIDDTIGCSGFVATGAATATGRMLHGRNLDYNSLDPIVENPVLFVRQPQGGARHFAVGWAGQVGLLTGMNEHGLAVELNENGCPSPDDRGLDGVPPMQQLLRGLTNARDLDEAETLVRDAPQASCQLFLVSHAPSDAAAVFEIWGRGVATRRLGDPAPNDVLLATNHFLHPDAQAAQGNRDIEDLTVSSVSRFTRLSERLTGASLPPHSGLAPEAPDFVHGRLDVELAADVLRDPIDLRPEAGRRAFPCTEHQSSSPAIGTNHGIHSVVMVGDPLEIWIAAGLDPECGNPMFSPVLGLDLARVLEGDHDGSVLGNVDPPWGVAYGDGVHD